MYQGVVSRTYVKIPVCWDFNQTSLLTCNEWLHPVLGLLLVVNLGPGISGSQIVRLAVVVAHAVIVLNAVREQQFGTFTACFPPTEIVSVLYAAAVLGILPWRNASSGRLASKLSQHAVRLIKHVVLLFQAHIGGVLVTVTVEAYFMSCIAYCCHVFRECLQTMAWNKPCGLDVVLLEHLQEALRTNRASEQTTRYVAGAVFSAIRPKPSTYRIYINTVRDENALLAHDGCIVWEMMS